MFDPDRHPPRDYFLGRYRLLRRIDRGGEAPIYQAVHAPSERAVAIRIVPSYLAENAAALGRFYRDVPAAAALEHPNLARVLDAGSEGRVHYLVSELVDGPDLRRLVEEHGPLPIETAADYIRQAAEGLAVLHDQRQWHLHLRATRMCVDAEGTIQLLEPLLDRLLDAYGAAETLRYCAPEQAIGHGTIGPRADIYALGGCCYYLLTGEHPFRGESHGVRVLQHCHVEPNPLADWRPDCPRGLIEICDRMLARRPADRFARCQEVAAALAPFTQEL